MSYISKISKRIHAKPRLSQNKFTQLQSSIQIPWFHESDTSFLESSALSILNQDSLIYTIYISFSVNFLCFLCTENTCNTVVGIYEYNICRSTIIEALTVKRSCTVCLPTILHNLNYLDLMFDFDSWVQHSYTIARFLGTFLIIYSLYPNSLTFSEFTITYFISATATKS